jgi:ParB/RepB/Spo0J family partition protein
MQRRPAAQPDAAPAAPDAPSAITTEFRRIPIDQLHESALNPRRHFHEGKLAELAASIRKSGVLTPLLARPTENGGGPAYELAAGHRRLRASRLAELAELPVLVRPMSDTEFLEILTIENLQREDVHPLEEAQGFADLVKHAGYDVARIADRVARSIKYVYDRLKLLQLTPAVQEVFFAGEITAGHAILLARLSADDQARAMTTLGAVFTHDAAERSPEEEEAADQRELKEWEEELDLDDRRKPMSVRELQSWIDKHVRFDETAPDVPDLFPATAAVLAPAIEQEEKIVKITHEHFIQPEARAEDERTIGPRSWLRADGQFGSSTCEHSVVGVVAVGPGRGEAFRVCIDKKKCHVHWGREIKESARRAKEREKGGQGAGVAAADRQAKEQAKLAEARAAEQEKRTAFEKARPAITEAVIEQLKKQRTGAEGPLGQLLIQAIRQYGSTPPKGLLPGSNADHLVRYLAGMILVDQLRYGNAHASFPRIAKTIGVDVAAILKGDTKPRFPAKKAAKKTAPKKARR